MSGMQKQHDWDDDEATNKPKAGQLQNIPEAKNAAQKAKDLLNKLEQVTKPKKTGHWEVCCGVRRWVED